MASRLWPARTLVLAGAAAYSMSTLFSAMKPLVLTAYTTEQGFSDALSAFIAAMPFVGIACAALVAAPIATRLSMRALTVLFGGTLIATELLTSLTVASAGIVLALQFLAGLSVGALMGATSAVIARGDNSDEIFGVVDMVAVLLMSVMVSAMSIAVDREGLAGAFRLAAGISALFALIMLADNSPSARSLGLGSVNASANAPLHIGFRELSVVTMAVLFVTASGMGFAYMFTIAADLGLSYEAAGQQIGVLLFVSAFACLAGGWCSARFGPYRPLGFAYATCAIGWWVATHTSSPIIYIAALVPAIFALQFCFPVLLALSGSLDENGRWAAIATPVQTSGFAWAAIAAGLVVQAWDIQALGVATAVGMTACLVLLWLALPSDRIKQRERLQESSGPTTIL